MRCVQASVTQQQCYALTVNSQMLTGSPRVLCSVLGMKEYNPDLWLLAVLEQDGNTQVSSYNALKCQVSGTVLWGSRRSEGELWCQGHLPGAVGI